MVQSVYAKNMLFTQLFKERGVELMQFYLYDNNRGLIASDEPVKQRIVTVFNTVWSDNADALSLFYSSSPSLKTDYTRFRYCCCLIVEQANAACGGL